MTDSVFNRPECCNGNCECPVCLENKPLMRLNCNHYICLDDIKNLLKTGSRCPICRVKITSYGCNGNNTQLGVWRASEEETSAFDFMGGKKRKFTRKSNRRNRSNRSNRRKRSNRRTFRKRMNKKNSNE